MHSKKYFVVLLKSARVKFLSVLRFFSIISNKSTIIFHSFWVKIYSKKFRENNFLIRTKRTRGIVGDNTRLFARRDIRSIINTTKRTKKAQRSTRHYAAERSLPVEFSPRNIRSLWRRRRGARVQRELETWLKILRCGRKWISDTRNATLFGTITRESPSKLPISPSAPAGNIFTRSEGTYLRLGVPAHTRAHRVTCKQGE